MAFIGDMFLLHLWFWCVQGSERNFRGNLSRGPQWGMVVVFGFGF